MRGRLGISEKSSIIRNNETVSACVDSTKGVN